MKAEKRGCESAMPELSVARDRLAVLTHPRTAAHLLTCGDCRRFGRQVEQQRADLAVALTATPPPGLRQQTLALIHADAARDEPKLSRAAAWSRRLPLPARVAIAFGLLLALPGALAGAGVDLPDPLRSATDSVGITTGSNDTSTAGDKAANGSGQEADDGTPVQSSAPATSGATAPSDSNEGGPGTSSGTREGSGPPEHANKPAAPPGQAVGQGGTPPGQAKKTDG